MSLFQNFIKLCTGRVGQLLNMDSLGNDCGISTNTIKSWLSILESSYIIFLLRSHYIRGKLFENMVIADLIKQRLNKGRKPNMYFWRDSKGNEVDCIIDKADKLIAIEIKAGQTVILSFFQV